MVISNNLGYLRFKLIHVRLRVLNDIQLIP